MSSPGRSREAADAEVGVSRTVRYQGTVEVIVEDTQRWRNTEVTLATIERETEELASHAREYLTLLLAFAEKQRRDGVIGVPSFGGRIRFGTPQRTAVAVLDADQ